MNLGLRSDAALTGAALTRSYLSILPKLRKVTRRRGEALRTRVRANASGRPGPRAQTGDYRRSIGLQTGEQGEIVWAEVGTNAPQGRRLEYGFMNMTDSLGRTYRQPPYPHFRPAADVEQDNYAKDIEGLVAEVITEFGR